MNELEAPLCACGCGNRVKGHRQWGVGKIIWNKYFSQRCPKGKQVGTKDKVVAARGYIFLYMPDHPHARGLYVPEHAVIAETALGRILPGGAEVHHVDENRQNNANNNLVICQNRAYHMLLHQRTDALKACGDASFRKCHLCQVYGDPNTMRSYNGKGFTHWECWRSYMRIYMKEYYQKNKDRIYSKVKEKRSICKTQTDR
jgi:HNH endonuclease